MKIHFQVEYLDNNGNNLETMSACDLDNPEYRKMMHDMLEDYLIHYKNDPQASQFRVGGVCECNKYDKKER